MGAERAIAAVLKRSVFFASRGEASLQDLIDCADLALALGERDHARRLYEVIWIRRGFGAQALARQHDEARSLGLWDQAPGGDAQEGRLPAFSVDRAIAELTTLVADAPLSQAALVAISSTAPPADLDAWLDTVCRALRDALGRGDGDGLDSLLDRLARELLAAGPLDLALHVGDGIGSMLAGLTYNALFHHLRSNHDMAYGPYGSARLFHRVARLSEGGLGPWLGGVREVVRSTRDILGMVALATPPEAEPDLRWTVPLATHLDRHQRLDLIDMLADRNAIAPLEGFLVAAMRHARDYGNREELWRIRDAGLDLGNAALAVAAQRSVALLAENDRVEWSILGEIHGTYDEIEQAEEAFAEALLWEPADPDTLARLKALRSGRFARFTIAGGFGSDAQRRRRRATHRPPAATEAPTEAVALAAGSAED